MEDGQWLHLEKRGGKLIAEFFPTLLEDGGTAANVSTFRRGCLNDAICNVSALRNGNVSPSFDPFRGNRSVTD